VSGLLPVQTYNGTTTRVGGEAPAKADAGNGAAGTTLASLNTGTTIAESQATVSITAANISSATTITSPDFGYNFDVVVNTNPAGQGSLRQFITNSNALGGENTLAQAGSNSAGALPTSTETSIFMIPNGTARPGLLASTNNGPASQLNANGVAVISPGSVLPTITSPNTSIDATTQTINIGDTNSGTLGTGGPVGNIANAAPLSTVNRPEVQLVGNRSFDGIVVGATSTTVRGLSLYGFDHNITVNTDITAFQIEQNVIGTSATSFTDPGVGVRTLNEGVLLNNADNGTVRNNLVGFNGGMGVWVLGNGNGANGNTVSNNEIRGNAQESRPAPEGLVFDGLELQGNSTNNTVSGNLITANYGHGIDSFGNGIGGNRVLGNTISNNGVGVATNSGEEGAGLRVFGATNPTIISNNVLSGNNGSGVLVNGSANNVTISQNSTFGNTRLGIDLISETGAPVIYNGNTGTTTNVTLNDNGDGDTGGNGLLNFPVLTTANVSGSSLVINGYARPGSLVELFLATPLTTDPTNSNRNFGQGSSYLASRTEGNTTDDSNGGNGTYGANNATVNGVYQGTDNTNLFTFTIPLANLTPAQRTALLSGNAVLTSTATLSNSTSEFSGNLTLPITDVTVALTGPATLSPGQPTGTYTATFTNEGPVDASTVTRTVTLPAGATNILVNGVAYSNPNTATPNVIDFGTATTLASGTSNAFSFSFTPATTATGTVAITSNVTTATSQGNNVAPDASTINAMVAPLANVFTTVTATTASVAAGTVAASRFTVTFNNSGPNTAANVVAAVQLPAGLTNVTATGGGVYNNITGVVTYANLTSIAPNTATTSIISFDAPASGPVVAAATISTTTNEAGQTANNSANAPVVINPAFDLTTTLSGPISAVAGDLVTLNVTTSASGASPSTNAVQTVKLPANLTNVYVSNGGTYNSTSGDVTFPTIATLPSGQTVANSVSFSMPTTAFTPTALVSTTSTGETNTGNNTAALNNTSGSSVAVATPTNIPGTTTPGNANAYTTISSSVATTTLGSTVTLTVVTGNNGPNAATGVTQTVQLQPGFTTSTLRVNNTAGSAPVNNVITFGTNGPTYNTLTGLLTFPTLTDGTNGSTSATSVSNTITLTPTAATVGSNGQLLAMAAVRTTNIDPVAADNVASVAVTLAQATDLATAITGPATAQSGQTVTYTASFINNGPMGARNVIETAQLPAGLGANGVTITDAAGNAVSGASYNSATGLVTFPTLATNPSGAQQAFKLSFVAPGQDLAVRSSVTSGTVETAVTNNSASLLTSITPAADLATVVSGPATAVVGNPVTYTVTTTNNGLATAANATTTLALGIGFTPATLQVNGVTGTANGTDILYNLPGGNTATYSTTNGVVTFPVLASLPIGTSAANYVSFVMPNPASGQMAGVASASASGIDPVVSNNTSSVATSVAPTTTTTADLVATVSAPSGSVTPGTTVTFTATYSNNAGSAPATNVMPTLQLLPGLTTTTLPSVAGTPGTTSGNLITFGTNGPVYNSTTGVLTFPTIASQAAGTTGNVSYAVQVVAPLNSPLVATAATTSSTTEPNTSAAQANNANSASVGITPSFDEVTSISGPATAAVGTSQTYTVTTTNIGPSATNNTTTQTVTVPAGQTPTNITNGGVYSNNTIVWTIPAGQGAGGSNAVANSFTIVQPAASVTLSATVSVTGESNSGNNTANITTAPLNLAPLAYAVVNTLQNPQSNEAGGLATGLLISPLNASDPENSFATTNKYTVTGPNSAQGTLYYNNGGTYTAIVAGASQDLTDAQAQTLRFKAATGFVGNASFTYLTTDAAGNTSPVVNYTIPVESDVDVPAYTLTPVKGGTTPYVVNDVIAYTTDANGAVYNAAAARVYQDNGALQTGASNGVASASAVAGSFTSSRAGVTSLADLGLSIDATGRIVVSNPGTQANPNLRSGNYSVQITTVDANGGVTTSTVAFKIPGSPLPVVLTAFTASAVQNRDAQLSWTTASEVNSAYFDIERSFDGTTYVKVGQVAAQGNTTLASTYAFTDAGVASRSTGAVYYRLKQVDLDAKVAYSPVRTISFSKTASPALSLYPNPAQSTTTLDLSQLPASGTYQVLVLDATGRQVRSASFGGGLAQTLYLRELATGTYHVLVTGTLADGSALRQTIRLTKE
jgi:uncharacterized repeat protein (TIGR01451 family)